MPSSQLHPVRLLNDSGPGITYSAGWSVSSGRTLVSTIDTASPARLIQQVVFTRRGLVPGPHLLRAVKRSGTYMLVDRLDTV